MIPAEPGPKRRSVLSAGLATLGLAACSTPSPRRTAEASPEVTRSRVPSSGSSRPALQRAKPYEPLPREVIPRCKIAAAEAVTRALTWTGGSAGDAASRLDGVHNGAQLASALEPLLSDDDACVTSVVYPQYGGLNAALTSASVMVVGRQTLMGRDATAPRTREFIVDVRLSGKGREWSITSATVGKLAVAANPPATVRRLLENSRVFLPEPARADLSAGVISDEVVSIVERLSRQWRLSIQVLRTGHPLNVFGTDRLSNHSRGRAVDIWAIDGVPVIGSERDLWEPVIREAARLGSTEVGGPRLPLDANGLPSVFFTNATHQDHLHLGFEPSVRAS